MADKPLPSPEEVRAFKARFAEKQRQEREAQQAITPTEVMAPTLASEWSSHDPACMDKLIRACITASLSGIKGPGVFESGRIACGCPQEVFAALRADTRWTVRYRQLVQDEVVLANLAVATQDAMEEGGAYGMAQSLNTAPKEDLSDDEKRRAAAFARMGPAELLKEVERHEKIMLGFKEKLLAGKSPPPAKIQQLAESAVGLMGEQPRGQSAAE